MQEILRRTDKFMIQSVLRRRSNCANDVSVELDPLLRCLDAITCVCYFVNFVVMRLIVALDTFGRSFSHFSSLSLSLLFVLY